MTFEDIVNKFKEECNIDIPKEELQLICSSPFRFLKDNISNGVLKNVRFKYLGVFEVNKPMVKYSKKTLEDKYSKGLVTEKRYNERIKILNQIQNE